MRAWLAVAFVVWMFGWAATWTSRLLPKGSRDVLTQALTAAGLSVGAITLFVLAALLAAPGRPVFVTAFLASVVLAIGGVLVRRDGRAEGLAPGARTNSTAPRGPLALALAGALLACGAGIVFNAAYWPFEIGDALDLYAPFGKHLYETSSLPIGDRLYEGYPMLIPIAFALTHWAAGSVNEYVARIVPALMALGAVGSAAALGGAIGSRRIGLFAAALVILTPAFGRWASTGYTDVPAAFFVGLAVLFAWHFRRDGERRAILLCGVAAGLAIWTKLSALAVLPGLVWLAASRGHPGQPSARRRWAWTSPAILIGSIAAVIGPWLVRNQFVFGFVVPPTVWTDRARHDLGGLTLMLRGDQFFGVPGWIFCGGLVYAAAALLTSPAVDREKWRIPMAVAAPYLAAWWWFASYETRFLMTILPILAVIGAMALDKAATSATASWPDTWIRQATLAASAAIVVLTALSLRKTVEHKAVLIRHPFLDDAGRHRVRLGGLYEVAESIARLPEKSRIGGVPRSVRYYIDERRLGRVDSRPIAQATAILQNEYDYVVLHTLDGQPSPVWDLPALLRTDDGYILVETRRIGPTASASVQEPQADSRR